MNIWNTPERQQLRKTVRSFAEREILPHVEEWERAGELPATCTGGRRPRACWAPNCPSRSAVVAATPRTP